MSRPRISAALIVKDEEHGLAACLQSIAPHVDEIVVVDTGSTDRTKDVAVQFGANVYDFNQRTNPESFFIDSEEECAKFGAPGPFSGEWALGDFAAARNASFDRCTGDFVVWVDADDIVDDAAFYREVVKDMVDRGKGIGFLAYNYARDHLGRVYYRQWRERVFRRGTARWHNPVHEVLMPTGPILAPERYEKPVHQHHRKADRKGIAHRNYKILLRQAWQLKTAKPSEKLDPRILFYLGQEARFVDPRRAVGFYEEYLQTSGWPEERAAAHVAIGSLLEFGTLGLPPEQAYAQAQREYATAAMEMPANPDGVLGMARVAYYRGRWHDCVRYTEEGFKIGNTDSMLGANPMDRLYRPHFFYNYALAQIGRLEDAVKSCEEALKVCADDPGIPGGASGMITLNLAAFKKAIEDRDRAKEAPMAQDGKLVAAIGKDDDLGAPPAPVPNDALVIWATQLWKQIVRTGTREQAESFLRSLPSSVTVDPVVGKMFSLTRGEQVVPATTVQAAAPAHEDVVIYVGPGFERWTPETPNLTGLGGSETAVIEMARELTKAGRRVVVYAEALGTFDGVEYRHHSSFRGTSCDVFIASRSPWAIREFGPVEAAVKLLWVHDIACGPPNPDTERWLLGFDRVLCLSNWHKQFFCSVYKTLDPEKVIVTRNGIDPKRFQLYLPKDNSLVFSSSPNRGLDLLLANFRIIRAQVPDATLHVYYGFDTWEAVARANNATQDLEVIERFKSLLPPVGQYRDGVHFHGKKSQREVANRYLTSKVWPYLTGFTETSCITAMEAQAAGCVPVCSALAALPETVKHGFLFPNEDPQTPQRWVEKVIELLRDESKRGPVADAGRKWAMENLSWEKLAREWDEMFRRVGREVAENPLQGWRAA